MRGPLATLALVACLALGACGRGELDVSARAALPPIPDDLAACFSKAFPEIPSLAFGRREAVRIMADAKLLDRAKANCGERALNWMKDVRAAFGRPTS
ncbi:MULTISPECIES: hypothetical protein [unclassified Methylobacterium]|uniref:hypothetical protein n=1 Tax=unclassified Methylobacterium TaxID=2615210 RepID=UPI0011C1DB6E|nr:MULTISPECIES: hypothetical protein [unclassified Methylobacterium]QEE39827.1 hypothetical protein FVA80_13560 [Methylobacterium sp. WL1]TXN57329.1 hypothetical protein FV241_11750 [Methylobacterium sp. WL2]